MMTAWPVCTTMWACSPNLSPDHIGPGEHKTFEEYRSWKGQLFKRCDVAW